MEWSGAPFGSCGDQKTIKKTPSSYGLRFFVVVCVFGFLHCLGVCSLLCFFWCVVFVLLLVRVFHLSAFKKSESYSTFGSFKQKSSEIFGSSPCRSPAWRASCTNQSESNSCYGLHINTFNFKPTVTRQLIPSPDYGSLSIAIDRNTTFALWLIVSL